MSCFEDRYRKNQLFSSFVERYVRFQIELRAIIKYSLHHDLYITMDETCKEFIGIVPQSSFKENVWRYILRFYSNTGPTKCNNLPISVQTNWSCIVIYESLSVFQLLPSNVVNLLTSLLQKAFRDPSILLFHKLSFHLKRFSSIFLHFLAVKFIGLVVYYQIESKRQMVSKVQNIPLTSTAQNLGEWSLQDCFFREQPSSQF